MADKFDSDLRRFGFAFEQQCFLVNDVDQVKIGEGLHIADEAVEAFFLLALRGIGFIEFFADLCSDRRVLRSMAEYASTAAWKLP